MARPLCITYTGAFYHIISRGNERNAIFLEPDMTLLGLLA